MSKRAKGVRADFPVVLLFPILSCLVSQLDKFTPDIKLAAVARKDFLKFVSSENTLLFSSAEVLALIEPIDSLIKECLNQNSSWSSFMRLSHGCFAHEEFLPWIVLCHYYLSYFRHPRKYRDYIDLSRTRLEAMC